MTTHEQEDKWLDSIVGAYHVQRAAIEDYHHDVLHAGEEHMVFPDPEGLPKGLQAFLDKSHASQPTHTLYQRLDTQAKIIDIQDLRKEKYE